VIVELPGRATPVTHWPFLDEIMVDLVERHKAYGNLTLQISSMADPVDIHRVLPRAAQRGVLEVRFSEKQTWQLVAGAKTGTP